MPRASKADVEYRILSVYIMLVEGRLTADILSHLMIYYHISQRQARTYMQRAQAMFEEEAEQIKTQFLAKSLARIDELYQSAMSKGDHALALTTLHTASHMVNGTTHDVSLNRAIERLIDKDARAQERDYKKLDALRNPHHRSHTRASNNRYGIPGLDPDET